MTYESMGYIAAQQFLRTIQASQINDGYAQKRGKLSMIVLLAGAAGFCCIAKWSNFPLSGDTEDHP
jgi:hypothetical protein